MIWVVLTLFTLFLCGVIFKVYRLTMTSYYLMAMLGFITGGFFVLLGIGHIGRLKQMASVALIAGLGYWIPLICFVIYLVKRSPEEPKVWVLFLVEIILMINFITGHFYYFDFKWGLLLI